MECRGAPGLATREMPKEWKEGRNQGMQIKPRPPPRGGGCHSRGSRCVASPATRALPADRRRAMSNPLRPPSPPFSPHLSPSLPISLGCLSAAPRLYLGCTSAAPRPYLGCTSASPRLYPGHTSAIPRPYLGYPSAVPRPYLGCPSPPQDMSLGLSTAPVLYAAEEYPELKQLILRKFEAVLDTS